jgi:hypothetical protein
MMMRGPVARGAGVLVAGWLVVDVSACDDDFAADEQPAVAIARTVAVATIARADPTRAYPWRSMAGMTAPFSGDARQSSHECRRRRIPDGAPRSKLECRSGTSTRQRARHH